MTVKKMITTSCKSPEYINWLQAYLRNAITQLTPLPRQVSITFDHNKTITIDKSEIQLCLCDEKNETYPINTIMYVIIHELAHVLCTSIGHTPEFHKINNELVERAIQLKLFDPKEKLAPVYCGVKH